MSRRAPLLPAAVGAWAAALACVLWPGVAAWISLGLWAVALVGLGALVALDAAVRRSRAGALGAGARRSRPAAVVVVSLAIAGASAGHVALAQPARAAVTSYAADGGRALEITAVVTSKVAGTASGALWFDADTITVAAGARVLAEAVPVAVSVLPEDVDGRAALDLGARVTVRGTAIATEGGDRAVLVVFASRGVEVLEPPVGVAGAASALRAGFVRLASMLPGSGGGLLPGLAVGDTSAVGAELDLAMKSSSLSHLTAVSGANCAIVVGLVFGLAALLGARRWVRVTAALAALAGFVVLVTPEPSVVRAAAMATAGMLGVLLGRATAGASALCLAVVVLLIGDPWLAMSLGFALSAAATAALLVLAPPLARALTRWMPRPLALILAVPLAAQLACGPLLVLVSPVVPLYGVAANLVAGVAAPPATILGLAACLLVPVAPWLAAAVAWMAWVPSAWIAATAETVATLPAASVPWLEGGWGAAALAAFGACIVVLVVRGGSSRARDLVLRTVALVAVSSTVGVLLGRTALTGAVGALAAPQTWSIAACDVGQGDAVLVRSEGRVALIDAGPDAGVLAACLSRLGVLHLDLVVLTHYDLDHVGGVEAILGRADVVLHGPAEDADRAILGRLAQGGARLVEARTGLSGALGGSRWRVVWPAAGARGFPAGNDASVVVEFRGGGVPTSIFLGDLSAAPQAALAASGRLSPPYSVVKVAHHGSADQLPALYRALRAAVAVVTVGEDNDYGHPRAETLRMLASLGVVVARTDRDGLVVIAQGGDGTEIWRERGPPVAEGVADLGAADLGAGDLGVGESGVGDPQ